MISQLPCGLCGTVPSYALVVTALGCTDTLTPRCEAHVIHCDNNLAILQDAKVPPPKQAKIKKLSQKQERQVMVDLGGRTQPASGAKPGHKGDGRLYDQIRMEAKFTLADSYSLKLTELSKLRGECEGNEEPLMVLDFKDRATGREKDRWAILPYTAFLNILRKAGVIQ